MSAEGNIQALKHVYDAAGRVAAQGLGTDIDGHRGLNNDGFQLLTDLATVLMMQSSQGSRTERVLAGACRTLLSAQAAVLAEHTGEPTGPHIASVEASLADTRRQARS